MEFFGITLDWYFILTIILGFVGVIWDNRRKIAKATETKADDRVVDILEGLCDSLSIDADAAAAKAKGKLKKELKQFELERKFHKKK